MLALQLGGTEDAEGSRRPGPVVLLPEHDRRPVQALALRARCGRDLRRPDPVEVGEQRRDLFRRRCDRAFVDLAYLHRIVSSCSTTVRDRRSLARCWATARPPGASASPPTRIQLRLPQRLGTLFDDGVLTLSLQRRRPCRRWLGATVSAGHSPGRRAMLEPARERETPE